MVQALSGRVEKAKIGWELGVVPTQISQRFSWMTGDRTDVRTDDRSVSDSSEIVQLMYVHQDQVTAPPPNATVFATTDRCAIAGFVVRDAESGETALGIQGHPEFTRAVTEKAIRSQPNKFPEAIAKPALESVASLENSSRRDSSTVARWIVRFLRST